MFTYIQKEYQQKLASILDGDCDSGVVNRFTQIQIILAGVNDLHFLHRFQVCPWQRNRNLKQKLKSWTEPAEVAPLFSRNTSLKKTFYCLLLK
jgi:hypothetical protein